MAGVATTFHYSPASSILSRLSPFSSVSLSSKPSSLLPMPGLRRTTLFRSRITRIMALSSNDIKVGTEIELDGAPWRVLEFLHVKPGKGAAFVRTKIRNFITGNTIEKTFRAGVTLDEANVYKETKQFTYKDGSQFVFMDLIWTINPIFPRVSASRKLRYAMNTFEETRLNESDVGGKTKWLKEGMDCNLLVWNGKVIGLEIPITVQLTVADVDPGLKGDTAQGGSKPATLETGAVVNVPLFINVGDTIIVDTRTGQYISRA